MKFLILHIENSTQNAVEQAVATLQKKHNLKLELKFWTIRQLPEGSPAWVEFENDFKTCDFFLANMITQADQIVPLERFIKQYGPTKPERAIVIVNSMPSLMTLTKMGDFEFTKLVHFFKEGPVAKISNLVGNIRSKLQKSPTVTPAPELDPDEVVRLSKAKTHGPARKNLNSGMVTAMRTLPNLLKLVPGQAQDLRAYMLIAIYWLNCSPENFAEFFKFVIDRYVPSYKGPKLKAKDPIIYPRLALFHPAVPSKNWEDLAEFEKWLVQRRKNRTPVGRVGLIMTQLYYLAGNHRHVTELVRQLEAEGMEVVPCFIAGLDARPAIEAYFLEDEQEKKGSKEKISPKPLVDLVINLSGLSLVGGPAQNDAKAAILQMQRLNRPIWSIISLLFQTESEWRANRTGLSSIQTIMQIAVPELDGACEPRIYAASVDAAASGVDKTIVPLPEEIGYLARRAARLARLNHKPNHAKKISLVLFCYPPNKGNVGTAAYLGVFESAWNLMKRLKDEGYTVENLPANADELRKALVEGNSATYGTNANLHAHVSVPDYQRLFPFWSELEPFWGPPPGTILSDSEGLQILGRQFGNLLIALQPTFGYEDDPLRLLMSDNVGTHHGFAAFYTYLNKIWDADAVLHFGTHGALEFMPGKQVGLSARCWPNRLLGDLPNFYLYCVNNPSEGTIAKRRGFATLISYLSPPMETAGLYRQLIQLKESLNRYRDKPSGQGSPTELEAIIEQAEALSLKPEVDPAIDPPGYVLALYTELLEIEERLIPTGLHILDEAPDRAATVDILSSIASFSRNTGGKEEEDVPALTDLIAQGLGYNLEEVRQFLSTGGASAGRAASNHGDGTSTGGAASNHGDGVGFEMLGRWEKIDQIQRQSVTIFVDELAKNPGLARRKAADYLTAQAQVALVQSERVWNYLAEVAQALGQHNEIEAILSALRGEYIEPSVGSNVVQNPQVLPTGRNIHSLDPSLIPTPTARRNADRSVKALLERAGKEAGLPTGAYPETIAMVLWGSDNIKSDGEGVAQCLGLIGARATFDGLGKVNGARLVPLAELGRPRLDVVITVSGIFRDLLPNQMELIDRAVRLAAQADEPLEKNFIRKHVQEEMAKGSSFDEAVSRVFSNAPGQYGANVNFVVENGVWEQDNELSEVFLARKSFVYGLKADGASARRVMEAALSRVELSFQNVDSAEVGLTDVDHYYEYLGGISKTVEKLSGGKRPPSLVADSVSASSSSLSQGNNIKTLEEAIQLEARTKLLNPKWYESMLKYGFEGVREIEVRTNNTYGWSATADAVDGWVYDGVCDTYVKDTEMRERLTKLNPYSFKGMVGRLLEANGRNFWEVDAETLELLKEVYAGLEDEIEGLTEKGMVVPSSHS